jgi:hypothetical protein
MHVFSNVILLTSGKGLLTFIKQFEFFLELHYNWIHHDQVGLADFDNHVVMFGIH